LSSEISGSPLASLRGSLGLRVSAVSLPFC
jgi:hypothetical protein